jgi:hypothetical protein
MFVSVYLRLKCSRQIHIKIELFHELSRSWDSFQPSHSLMTAVIKEDTLVTSKGVSTVFILLGSLEVCSS